MPPNDGPASLVEVPPLDEPLEDDSPPPAWLEPSKPSLRSPGEAPQAVARAAPSAKTTGRVVGLCMARRSFPRLASREGRRRGMRRRMRRLGDRGFRHGD